MRQGRLVQGDAMSMYLNPKQVPKVITASIVLAIAGLGLGCQQEMDSLNRVTGQVTFKGEPVPMGVIQFTPDASSGNKGMAGFAEIRDGKYDTETSGRGVESGAITVTIDAYSMKNINPDIKPHGDALIIGYKQKTSIGTDSTTELDFEIARK